MPIKVEPRAIIFDLDDTLYPERDYVISGFRAASLIISEKYGFDQHMVFQDLVEYFDRGERGNNFNNFLERKGIAYTDGSIRNIVTAYRSHEPEISLPEASEKVLHLLKRKGYKLGLLTDGFYEVQVKKVRKLGLGKILDEIIYTDKYGADYWKPNPGPFMDMAKRLRVEIGQCVYIGDNPTKDFKGAKESGMLTIQTNHWVNRDSSGLENDYLPDIIIEDLSKIPDILDSISIDER